MALVHINLVLFACSLVQLQQWLTDDMIRFENGFLLKWFLSIALIITALTIANIRPNSASCLSVEFVFFFFF